jgi:hypothetical protein
MNSNHSMFHDRATHHVGSLKLSWNLLDRFNGLVQSTTVQVEMTFKTILIITQIDFMHRSWNSFVLELFHFIFLNVNEFLWRFLVKG